MPGWHSDFAATPPFHHVAAAATQLAGADWPSLTGLDQLAAAQDLRNAAGRPVRFAAQHAHCGQRDYEAAILATGEVPSRERNWHDLFNALAWLAFPRTKAALNAVQCAALQAKSDGPRGALSDAATLFDESGLVLVGPDPALADLLAARRWQEAFVTQRHAWQAVRAYVFGHAILEKLLQPWPGITAKCLFLALPEGSDPARLDAELARVWQQGRIRQPADLFPLPVLGIPGWWPANQAPDFYADSRYFRPPPAVKATLQPA